MLGEPVGHHHERKTGVRRGRVLVPRSCFRFGPRICLTPGIDRVPDRRLERFVMSGQRSIAKPDRDPDPSEAVPVQEERLVSRQSSIALGVLRRLIVRRLRRREIGNVEARPFLAFEIPPNELLSLAPGIAVGTSGSAIVKNSPVRRPSEPPSVAIETLGGPLVRPILAHLWKDTGINPTAARGRAIRFERCESRYQFMIRYDVAVDFLQDFFGNWLAMLAFNRIVPLESQKTRIPCARIALGLFPEQHAEMIGKPVFAAAIPGRFDRFLSPLEQPL